MLRKYKRIGLSCLHVGLRGEDEVENSLRRHPFQGKFAPAASDVHAVIVDVPRQPEIADLDRGVVGPNQDVTSGQITMNEPLLTEKLLCACIQGVETK